MHPLSIMTTGKAILNRSRFFWMLGIAGTLIGILSWITIPKEEDPRLKNRFGMVKIIYPGASVPQIRQYVILEIEKELASIDSIDKIFTTIRSEFAVIRIQFKPELKDDSKINRAWDEVDEALERAYRLYPEGAQKPDLDRKLLEQEAMLIAIHAPEETGHGLLVELENELLRLPKVSNVRRIGAEGEEISLLVNERALANSGLSLQQLMGQIILANSQISSGYIETSKKRINVQVGNSFESLVELEAFPIATLNGSSIPLSRLAIIKRQPRQPASEEMRWNGQKVLGLGIISKREIDLREFGKSVEDTIADFQEKLVSENTNGQIIIINSQPRYVQNRLTDLSFSLLSSIFLLSAFMILFMGFRVGISVSIMLPVISLISFGIYSFAGGILHQIAIAAFVLSFGILIDNIVVIVESVQERLDSGMEAFESGLATISEFSGPLLSSTITTIASFLPMALAKDNSAEFTEAIPKIVIISLIVSYLASITLSPSLAMKFLKQRKTKPDQKDEKNRLGDFIFSTVWNHPKKLVISILALTIGIFVLFPFLKFKFFPSADRNQMILELSFPEGTSFEKTRETTTIVEERLKGVPGLTGVASFLGRSTAYFYYNLPQKPNAPHLVQFLLITDRLKFDEPMRAQIQESVQYLGAKVRFKSLEQGPPMEASVIVRIYHPDREVWKENLIKLASDLNEMPGVQLAWSDAEGVQEKFYYKPDDKSLAELGSNRRDLALSILKRTYGIETGKFKSEFETIPIVLSSQERERSIISELDNSLVFQTQDRAILANQVSQRMEESTEAIHHHYNRRSYVSLSLDLDKDTNPAKFTGLLTERLTEYNLVPGKDFEFDGEKGNSDESNLALLKTLPIGMTILLAALIWEFNSFRFLLIILTSVPFAFLGMIPGLVFSGQPFGFLP
jgi:multidrug efflux pump subunit AcrB